MHLCDSLHNPLRERPALCSRTDQAVRPHQPNRSAQVCACRLRQLCVPGRAGKRGLLGRQPAIPALVDNALQLACCL